MAKQSPSSIFMIRPAEFNYNEQTAESNAFQEKDSDETRFAVQNQAIAEFDHFVELLREKGIEVIVFEDIPFPVKPDAIFPNNWISMHEDGRVFLYPMLAPNRRHERRPDILTALKDEYHFQVKEIIDLSFYENNGRFLEGTGSIVFDHPNKLGYANRSPRTDTELVRDVCRSLGYKPVIFTAQDAQGQDIYHTNVLMAIGEKVAVICSESLVDLSERERVLELLRNTGHEVVEISLKQMNRLAGNMIELSNNQGEHFMIMSQRAFKALTAPQLALLRQYITPLPVPVYTIEKYGGGGVRCMIAGIHLPKVTQTSAPSLENV